MKPNGFELWRSRPPLFRRGSPARREESRTTMRVRPFPTGVRIRESSYSTLSDLRCSKELWPLNTGISEWRSRAREGSTVRHIPWNAWHNSLIRSSALLRKLDGGNRPFSNVGSDRDSEAVHFVKPNAFHRASLPVAEDDGLTDKLGLGSLELAKDRGRANLHSWHG